MGLSRSGTCRCLLGRVSSTGCEGEDEDVGDLMCHLARHLEHMLEILGS